MKTFHFKKPRLLFADLEVKGGDLAVEIMYAGKRFGGYVPILPRRRSK
jgi:hypothetical protein